MSLFNFELDQAAKLFEELKRSNGRSKDNQATLLLLLDKIFIVLYSLQFQIDEGKTVAQVRLEDRRAREMRPIMTSEDLAKGAAELKKRKVKAAPPRKKRA